jgi:hypothetical protein
MWVALACNVLEIDCRLVKFKKESSCLSFQLNLFCCFLQVVPADTADHRVSFHLILSTVIHSVYSKFYLNRMLRLNRNGLVQSRADFFSCASCSLSAMK